MPETTTLPIPPDLFWAIAGLGEFALFVLIVYGILIPATVTSRRWSE